MKKIYLLLFALLLLTGCSSDYNLVIDENLNYNESFSVEGKSNYTDKEIKLLLVDNFDYATVNEQYDLEITSNQNEFEISGSSRENINDLDKSNYLLMLYDDISIKEGLINIKGYSNDTLPTEAGATFPGLEDIKMNITLPFKILKHNAYDESSNTLTYIIKNNQFPDQIYIKFDPKRLYGQRYFGDIFDYISIDLFALISVGLVSFIGLSIFALKKRKKDKQYHINY